MLRLLITMAVSVGLIYLLFIQITGHSLAEVVGRLPRWMLDTSKTGLLLYPGLLLTGLILRSWRYQILLRASNTPVLPSFWQIAWVTAVRNMLVDLLPARLGELSYIALLRMRYKVDTAACTSSLAIAFIFDFVALLLLLCLVLAWQLFNGSVAPWIWVGTFLLSIACVLALWMLFKGTPVVIRILQWIYDKQSFGFITRLTRFFAALDDAIQATKAARCTTKVLLLSIGVRSLKYFSLYLLFKAVCQLNFPTLNILSAEQVFLILLGGEIGASMPIPAFMSFGTYEAGGVLTFSALGLDQSTGLMALFVTHVWSQSFDYSLGILGLALIILNLEQINEWRQRIRLRYALGFGGLAVIALVAASYFLNILPFRNGVADTGQSTLSASQSDYQFTQSQLNQYDLNGFAVWSSNRYGNHDIVMMSLPEMEVIPLTDHPHSEFYPRISPDGSRIIFARSIKTQETQRNWVDWQVILKDLDSGDETLLANNASFPHWVDVNTVAYLKDGTKVETHNLVTKQRNTVFRAGEDNHLPSSTLLSTPEYFQDMDSLVFTGRQSAIGLNTGTWGTAVTRDGDDVQGLHNGCQIFWSADGSYLFQVGKGGKQSNQFFKIDLETGQASPWLDLPGDYSHEYFPRMSRDGRFLTFAASTGGHEHDQADYEIFVWPVDQDPEEAFRLSFHSGNDNWPDLYLK